MKVECLLFLNFFYSNNEMNKGFYGLRFWSKVDDMYLLFYNKKPKMIEPFKK